MQISSASGELQKLKAEQGELTPLAAIRGRICNRCHQSGHTETTCKSRPCESSNCKIREKHPEMKAKISSLQAELKELHKQHEKQRSELILKLRCRQRKIKIEFFFSVMRNRLRMQNLPKYSDRLKLGKDLLVLQRALRNEVPKWDLEEGDWQLPIIIEQFHHAKGSVYQVAFDRLYAEILICCFQLIKCYFAVMTFDMLSRILSFLGSSCPSSNDVVTSLS